jgi:hypothetical protein
MSAAAAASAPLAERLLEAVRERDFGATPDRAVNGAPVRHFPSIDLAVAAFTPAGRAHTANVLFSREHPQGLVAPIDAATAGPAHGATLRFECDQQNAQGESFVWAPGADWRTIPFVPLAGDPAAAHRFVAPYPASLLKLMVAVGVGMALDRGLIDALPDALEPMIVVSDNDATDACVALLHRVGLIGPAHNAVNEAFAARGLVTLQLNRTTTRGGWRNADGSGVGHIHMTAWDTVRLLWLLDPQAPPAPWLAAGTPPLLSDAMRVHLHGVLTRQQLDEILSSGKHRGEPGWVPGLPDAPAFAHKTGTTDNYASDAGIVRTPGCHYAVAVLTSLGRRFAATPNCATTWRLPALGAAVHAAVEALTR